MHHIIMTQNRLNPDFPLNFENLKALILIAFKLLFFKSFHEFSFSIFFCNLVGAVLEGF